MPVRDSVGNLYGTTAGGGASGAGVVFKVNAAGQETVLYSFTGGADGASPYVGVILGRKATSTGPPRLGGNQTPAWCSRSNRSSGATGSY